MKTGQFFNHFHNNKALTTKSELNKNLNKNINHIIVEDFQPRTFDLGNPKQRSLFWSDFLITALGSLLWKLFDYFQETRK